jgi:hypothetical protein
VAFALDHAREVVDHQAKCDAVDGRSDATSATHFATEALDGAGDLFLRVYCGDRGQTRSVHIVSDVLEAIRAAVRAVDPVECGSVTAATERAIQAVLAETLAVWHRAFDAAGGREPLRALGLEPDV